MIILCEFVDFIKVIRIYAEVPFDRFSKELHFVGVCLGDFVVVAQCWIIALTYWLEKVLDFVPWIGVAERFPTILCFYPKFVLNLFLQLVNAHFYSWVFVLRVLSPKPTFLLN